MLSKHIISINKLIPSKPIRVYWIERVRELSSLSKKERILRALNGEEVDRIPSCIWLHHPSHDQDPRALAEIQVEFMRKYDFDFVKISPFGLYSVHDWGCKVKFFCTETQVPEIEEYAIKNISDWSKLEVLPAVYGTWGKQLLVTKCIKELLNGEETPFIQTIFSPLTTALKLAGDRLFKDLREHPDEIHQALDVITETTINFIKANIEIGVSGFFFASQCATTDLLTEEEYDEFGVKYDLQLFDSFKDETYLNIIHIHGENIMFDKLASYPGSCINWHDRTTGPSIDEARKRTDKCLIGGIDEKNVFINGSKEDIEEHIYEALELVGDTKFILGPGCVANPGTSEEHFFLMKEILQEKNLVSQLA